MTSYPSAPDSAGLSRWGAAFCALTLLVALAGGGCALFGPTPRQRVKQAAALDNPAEKRETFLELSAEPHPDMRPELRRVLRKGRHPMVRALAAEAMGRLGGPQDAKALRKAVRNDPHWLVRKRSLTWWCRIRGSKVYDELKRTLDQDSSPLVRVEAVELALLHAKKRNMFRLMMNALGDRAGAVRMMACAELQTVTAGSFPAAPGPWQSYLRRAGLLQGTQ